jgi:hypothetical protein
LLGKRKVLGAAAHNEDGGIGARSNEYVYAFLVISCIRFPPSEKNLFKNQMPWGNTRNEFPRLN